MISRVRTGIEEFERDAGDGEVGSGVGSVEGGELDGLVGSGATVRDEGRVAVPERSW